MLQYALKDEKYRRINTQSANFQDLMKQSIQFYQIFSLAGFVMEDGTPSFIYVVISRFFRVFP